MPRALAAFEWITAFDRKMMQQNHARLTELYRHREPDMFMVCSHDGTQYEQAKATAYGDAMQVTSETTVAAPIDVVWDKLSNHVGMSQWGPGITVTMDRPGTGDPNGVGAVRRIASPGPGPDIVEEIVAFEAPNLLGYKALSGTPFPGYAGEVRLTSAASGTHISYTVSSTASFPLVKAPLAVVCRVLLRLLARASTKKN